MSPKQILAQERPLAVLRQERPAEAPIGVVQQ
jgi:hypothetical protein